jgi:small subunit ribosomal protein S8
MDKIGNMLTTIRNGYLIGKKQVTTDYSNFRHEIAKVLVKSGYIEKVSKKKNRLIIKLKYNEDEKSVINEIISVSKPGRRTYLKASDIKPYKPLAGHGKPIGDIIISTSQGVMTGQEAKKKKIGGQLLFKIS